VRNHCLMFRILIIYLHITLMRFLIISILVAVPCRLLLQVDGLLFGLVIEFRV
jgi:hypothetical protein